MLHKRGPRRKGTLVITSVREGSKLPLVNTVEIHGENLVVNVTSRQGRSMYLPTMKIPLGHVLDATADPEIERKYWRAWAFGRGLYCFQKPVPGPSEVTFYNPRHGFHENAIVIRLKDEPCERLVVEVQDPEAVVAQINQAVGAC